MKFLVVDVETTNKNPSLCEIIEAAAIAYDSDTKEEFVFHKMFNARRWDREAEEASLIHGIKKDQLVALPYFTNDGNPLLDFIRDNIDDGSFFCCHSHRKIFGKFSSYDYTAIRVGLFPNHFDLYKKLPTGNIISTHSLAKYLDVPGKLDLSSLAQYFNLKKFNHHSAMDDAEVCLELLKIMLPKVDLMKFLEEENHGVIKDEGSEEPQDAKRKPVKFRNTRRNL